MYNEFFGFEKNPFASTPDPAFFYRSKQHDTSLRSLTFAVQAQMGLSALMGEEGTGKTLVLQCLRESLELAHIPCAFLRDSRISTSRFFQTIASELDLRCQGTSAYHVFSTLHKFTIQQARKGHTVALIVDDAHNLSSEVLNEILHLASLRDDKVKLLQTVFAGRPDLHSTLDALNLERLQQHAILSCNLQPFTAQETEDYIAFRLECAGLPEQKLFSPDAIAEIHQRSRGFAPAIHALCEGLLLAAFSENSKVCGQEILDRVFKKSRQERLEILDGSGTVVAVTRIDLTRLAAAKEIEPEPIGLQITLLRLGFIAMRSIPPPLPVKANDLMEPQRVALRLVFPVTRIARPTVALAAAPKKPILIGDGFKASNINPPVQPTIGQAIAALPAMSGFIGRAEPRQVLVRMAMNANPSYGNFGPVFTDGSSIPSQSCVLLPTIAAPSILAEPRAFAYIAMTADSSCGNLVPAFTDRSSIPGQFAVFLPTIAAPVVFPEPRRALMRLATSANPSHGNVGPAFADAVSLRGESIVSRPAMPQPVVFAEPRHALLRLVTNAKPSTGNLGYISSNAPLSPSPVACDPKLPDVQFQTIGAPRVSTVRLSMTAEPPAGATRVRAILAASIAFHELLLIAPESAIPEACTAVEPRILRELASLSCGLGPTPGLPGLPAGRDPFTMPRSLPLLHLSADLQPAGTVRWPRVPFTSLGIANYDSPLLKIGADVHAHSVNVATSAAPLLERELTCGPGRKPARTESTESGLHRAA